MEVVTYLKIIGRYWWLVLLATLAATGMSAALSLTRAPSYSVQARVVAKPATSVLTTTNDLVSMVSEMGMRPVIGTFAQIFTSAEVKQAARAAVGLDEAEAKDYPLQANVLPDTTVIEVSAKGRDPQLLTDYVNATVDAAVARAPGLFGVIELQPLEQATLPEGPTSPVPSRDIPVGGGLGLALGILLAFGMEYLRTPRRVEYEPQIRSLVPNGIQTPPALPQLPSSPQSLARDDMRVINGGQSQPRQQYLVPGRQHPIGWQNGTDPRAGQLAQPERKEDTFPG
jgi:succinoglycan biosynthesis transport protein ExoP